MSILLGVLEQGIIYAIMALGIYITYKILDFPDLTADGSFPLGAAVTAAVMVKGVNPYLALVIAFAAGVLSGIVTGIIHVKLKVRDLLSGIIVMTGLYSVNLRIAGKSNVPIFNMETIFDNAGLNNVLPESVASYQTLFVVVAVALASKFALDAYLKTKSGYLLRAVGDNSVIVTTLAKDSGFVKILGLAIANGLIALSGSVMCQQQRFFEISMGTGTMVIGLASVIIGTNLFKNFSKVRATTAVIIGAVIYKGCVAAAIKFGLSATDMKLVTAVLFLIILVLSRGRVKKVKNNA
ncbi:ABC transporter permease [Anaerobium acetethylicum]|uniref:Putative ABC transport system permease protein n=1 Tax=Anaerobium acetethylicum TaxID=1619234 RepID=A0A1D3TVE4_9FIRM|nr:ABC transporter permease [Anaerobium acetethylicum]SCP98085.1 putative ABC transport system permease protein [Anaerobium acetethylicum]